MSQQFQRLHWRHSKTKHWVLAAIVATCLFGDPVMAGSFPGMSNTTLMTFPSGQENYNTYTTAYGNVAITLKYSEYKADVYEWSSVWPTYCGNKAAAPIVIAFGGGNGDGNDQIGYDLNNLQDYVNSRSAILAEKLQKACVRFAGIKGRTPLVSAWEVSNNSLGNIQINGGSDQYKWTQIGAKHMSDVMASVMAKYPSASQYILHSGSATAIFGAGVVERNYAAIVGGVPGWTKFKRLITNSGPLGGDYRDGCVNSTPARTDCNAYLSANTSFPLFTRGSSASALALYGAGFRFTFTAASDDNLNWWGGKGALSDTSNCRTRTSGACWTATRGIKNYLDTAMPDAQALYPTQFVFGIYAAASAAVDPVVDSNSFVTATTVMGVNHGYAVISPVAGTTQIGFEKKFNTAYCKIIAQGAGGSARPDMCKN